MEKQGVVKPGLTRDHEGRASKEKQAEKGAKVKALDDDFTKRAAESVRANLK